jgi:hypothetical protein
MTEKPGRQAGILCVLMIHKTEEELRGVEKNITEGEEGSMSFLPSQFKMFSVISVVKDWQYVHKKEDKNMKRQRPRSYPSYTQNEFPLRLTYLRAANKRVGLLINFNVERL